MTDDKGNVLCEGCKKPGAWFEWQNLKGVKTLFRYKSPLIKVARDSYAHRDCIITKAQELNAPS